MSLESKEQHVLGVAGDIEATAKEVRALRQRLSSVGKNAARAIVDYEKAMGVTLIKLRNGREMTVGNEIIKNPPVTTTEKIAKAICYDQNLTYQVMSHEYTALTANLKAAIAELSAYQTKYRHLAE